MTRVKLDPAVKFFISAIGIITIFGVLMQLQSIFIPFILAYFLFFVFKPLNNYLEKKKSPSWLNILINFLIIIGVGWGFSRLIYESFDRFWAELPGYEQKLNHIVTSTALSFGVDDPLFTEFNLSEYVQTLDYGGIASGFFSSTLTIFSTMFLVMFFYLFIGNGHQRILTAVKRRYKYNADTDDASSNLKIEDTFSAITDQVQQYIITKVFVSLLTALFSAGIMWLFGVDFFIVWAVLTFLLNFIPNIGSPIAVILPALTSLVQFESIGTTILLTSILTVVQSSIGNIVEPKIMGDRLGLNPLTVLLSLLVWGYIWGVVGMFLSVPLTAIFKIIISNTESKNLQFISDLISSD